MDSSGLWRGAGTWLDSLRGRGGARRGASWLCTVLACSVLMLTVVGGALSSRPAFQVLCCPLPWLGLPGSRAVPPALMHPACVLQPVAPCVLALLAAQRPASVLSTGLPKLGRQVSFVQALTWLLRAGGLLSGFRFHDPERPRPQPSKGCGAAAVETALLLGPGTGLCG